MIDEIRERVGSDPRWASRALVVLYARQTASEQESHTTHVKNGCGFNGVDAGILSSFAEQVLRGRRLSLKQLRIAYKKLPKYAGQLLKIAEDKENG
jgi:hypothetical protein